MNGKHSLTDGRRSSPGGTGRPHGDGSEAVKGLNRCQPRHPRVAPWEGLADRSTLPGVIDELRAAVEALSRGDTGPFVALIDDDSEWRGVASGRLWWKHEPS